jgi:hypothetical protein
MWKIKIWIRIIDFDRNYVVNLIEIFCLKHCWRQPEILSVRVVQWCSALHLARADDVNPKTLL